MIVGLGREKALAVRAFEDRKENEMSRIITMTELQNRPLAHLQRLHHQVQQELAQSAPDGEARRNALASLENISRAITHARRFHGPRF